MDYPIQGGGYRDVIGIAAGNIRLDTKLAKNFTLFVQTSVLGGFGKDPEYDFYFGQPPTSSARFKGSILNLNFTVGFKFDFYDGQEMEQKYQEKLSELNK
jgi:hypothetical protein